MLLVLLVLLSSCLSFCLSVCLVIISELLGSMILAVVVKGGFIKSVHSAAGQNYFAAVPLSSLSLGLLLLHPDNLI